MPLQIKIASPCGVGWESMQGDERVRHCAQCSLNVFNIKELTEQEVRALFMKTQGRVCGQVYQRKDGTVLTRDCPTALSRVRRRALGGLTVALSLVLAVISFRWGTARSCATDAGAQQQGWFVRLFEQRFIDARETLRETRTFGPIINELYPVALPMAGLMVMTPPPPPSP